MKHVFDECAAYYYSHLVSYLQLAHISSGFMHSVSIYKQPLAVNVSLSSHIVRNKQYQFTSH